MDDIIKNKYYLGINKYLKTEEIKHEGLEYKKLDEISTFISGKRRLVEEGKESGKYKFFTEKLLE